MKLTPPKYRRQARNLLEQFSSRGNELTWNSDGIIFIDQISIPNSDIFVLFPYLFKAKHPKNLNGFNDFVQKISEMGLDHLIAKKSLSTKKSFHSLSQSNDTKSAKNADNWWYLG